MPMRLLPVLLLIAVATGCATAELERKPTSPGQALIYVYRPSNMLGAFINGAVTLTGPGGFSRSFPLRNDKYVATVVPAGSYSISATGAWGKVIANNMLVDASDGSATFVRCVFHKTCEQLPESEGEREVTRCKENVNGD